MPDALASNEQIEIFSDTQYLEMETSTRLSTKNIKLERANQEMGKHKKKKQNRNMQK